MFSRIIKQITEKVSRTKQEKSKDITEDMIKKLVQTSYASMYKQNISRPKIVSLRKCVTPTIKETNDLYDLKESLAISYSGFTRKSVQYLLQLDTQKPITRKEVMLHEKTNKLAEEFRVTTNLNEREVQGLKKIVERTRTTYSAVIRYAIWRNL